MPLNFIIPIEPQGKKVPRITRNGNFKDPETRAAMEAVAAAVRQQYQGEPFDGPLRVRILAYRTRPKTKKHEVYADTKPDYDNIEKLLGDALEGILWVNDSRIVDGRCVKLYAPKDKPGWIEITVDRLSQKPLRSQWLRTRRRRRKPAARRRGSIKVGALSSGVRQAVKTKRAV